MRHAHRTTLVALLAAIWVAAICLGLLLQALDDPWAHRPKPLPTTFDTAFRRFGGLFVAIAWSIRMLLLRICGAHGSERSSNSSRPALAPLSLALVYSGHAAIRAAMYSLHTYAMKTKTIAGHVMSDHILLSSCVLVGLLCELYVALREAGKHQGRQRALSYSFGVLLVMVIIGLAMEVFATARHFHDWSDAFMSVGLGGVAFKYTAWRKVLRRRY